MRFEISELIPASLIDALNQRLRVAAEMGWCGFTYDNMRRRSHPRELADFKRIGLVLVSDVWFLRQSLEFEVKVAKKALAVSSDDPRFRGDVKVNVTPSGRSWQHLRSSLVRDETLSGRLEQIAWLTLKLVVLRRDCD